MTKPTAHDAAGVSQETAKHIAELETIADFMHHEGHHNLVLLITAAIDSLIALDHAAHPRERALHQDAKRGNFRQEDDGA